MRSPYHLGVATVRRSTAGDPRWLADDSGGLPPHAERGEGSARRLGHFLFHLSDLKSFLAPAGRPTPLASFSVFTKG